MKAERGHLVRSFGRDTFAGAKANRKRALRKLTLVACLMLVAGPAHAGDAEKGRALFLQTCRFCHQVGENARNSVGPILNGVVGRPVGGVPGYSYSKALKDAGIVWDEASLRSYLEGPSAFIPGTKMTFAGFRDPARVDDVIAYLKTLDGAAP